MHAPRIVIISDDLVEQNVDAVVNAAHKVLLLGAGVAFAEVVVGRCVPSGAQARRGHDRHSGGLHWHRRVCLWMVAHACWRGVLAQP